MFSLCKETLHSFGILFASVILSNDGLEVGGRRVGEPIRNPGACGTTWGTNMIPHIPTLVVFYQKNVFEKLQHPTWRRILKMNF